MLAATVEAEGQISPVPTKSGSNYHEPFIEWFG
jgi:hypothetical protein